MQTIIDTLYVWRGDMEKKRNSEKQGKSMDLKRHSVRSYALYDKYKMFLNRWYIVYLHIARDN